MLIFTNCLSETPDEGCLRVANAIIKRIKNINPDVTVVSYERRSAITDDFVSSNKLILTKDIIKTVRKEKGRILYVPFPARSSATALRIFILSLLAAEKIQVILSQVTDIGFVAKLLLKLCKAEFIVLSNDTQTKLSAVVGAKRVRRIKAGVDTNRFVPVTKQRSAGLKKKYGFDSDKPVVLHVGHLNSGRNVGQLAKISADFQVLLVTSTLTKDEQDAELKSELTSCPNIKIIDYFLPDIEEVYQLSDVYFFPVKEEGRCIDSPLSCLEAASCNKPVVTTDFGEMKEFKGKNGFWFIESFEPDEINRLIKTACDFADINTRACVAEYDWNHAVKTIFRR